MFNCDYIIIFDKINIMFWFMYRNFVENFFFFFIVLLISSMDNFFGIFCYFFWLYGIMEYFENYNFIILLLL